MREFAIRQALGASRSRLVRQVLTEGVLISLTGAAAALLVLPFARGSLLALLPQEVPRLNEIHGDWRLIALALVLSVFSGETRIGVVRRESGSVRACCHLYIRELQLRFASHGEFEPTNATRKYVNPHRPIPISLTFDFATVATPPRRESPAKYHIASRKGVSL